MKHIILIFSPVKTALFYQDIKNIVLNFSLLKIYSSLPFFFYFSRFSIYKTVDSEYNTNIYKSVKISIGTVITNPEMIKLVFDHFITKKMCKHVVKELSFVIRYVFD